MQTSENDISILTGLKNGNINAFDTIYNKYYRQLCYFAFNIVKDKEAAEDLAAEAFIKLWQSRPEFASIDKVKSWMFTLIHHSALNLIKARQRHEASHNEIGRLRGTEENIDLILIRSEALQAIYEEIMNLPRNAGRW